MFGQDRHRRYGQNFRGVKALAAQEAGAVALLLYSDPRDDGYFRGNVYPRGPIARLPASSEVLSSSPLSTLVTPPHPAWRPP